MMKWNIEEIFSIIVESITLYGCETCPQMKINGLHKGMCSQMRIYSISIRKEEECENINKDPIRRFE